MIFILFTFATHVSRWWTTTQKSKKFKTIGYIQSPNIGAFKCHNSQTTFKFHRIINRLRETASKMAPLSSEMVYEMVEF